MGDALDFDSAADALTQPGGKKKRAARKVVQKDKPKPARVVKTRKRVTSKMFAYALVNTKNQFQGAELSIDPQNAPDIHGPFATREDMLVDMHANDVKAGDTVIVYRELQRGPLKTKSWIG